jgi:hypothetical protein
MTTFSRSFSFIQSKCGVSNKFIRVEPSPVAANRDADG